MPGDFPAEEMQEFFNLHARMGSAPQVYLPELQQRHEELHLMMCHGNGTVKMIPLIQQLRKWHIP